jgi:hypothetical protein
VHVADDVSITRSLLSITSQKKSIFLSQNQKILLTKERDKYGTVLILLSFSRESDSSRRYLKEHVSYIKYTAIRFRYYTGRTSFHGSWERNVYIYIYIYIYIYSHVHICASHCHTHHNNRRTVSYFPVLRAVADENPSKFMGFTSAKPNTYRQSNPWLEEKFIF